MNEQNPPPYHLKNAEFFHKIETGLLLGCVLILACVIVAINTNNLLLLLLVFLFLTLPLSVGFLVVNRKIRYWEKPYRLYAKEFFYKAKLKSGFQVPIQVEYQFPTTANTPNTLNRIDGAAIEGINKSFSSLYVAPDYEETRKIFVEVLEEETQRLGIEVFRIRILKIDFPPLREQSQPAGVSSGYKGTAWQLTPYR